MRMSGNTILITDGDSNFGRVVAEAFYARGHQVIVSGRSRDRLQAVLQSYPSMVAIEVDITDRLASLSHRNDR